MTQLLSWDDLAAEYFASAKESARKGEIRWATDQLRAALRCRRCSIREAAAEARYRGWQA